MTVIGAAGVQGGGVVTTFLIDPVLNQERIVRAVTRDPTKEKARNYEEQGAEVVVSYTSTENHVQVTNGTIPNVHHFDGKAEVEEYARSTGIPATAPIPVFDVLRPASGISPLSRWARVWQFLKTNQHLWPSF